MKTEIKLGMVFGKWTVIDAVPIYTKGGQRNVKVQWVTPQANKCKHVLSMSELYEFAHKVLNHANQQPSQPLKKLEGPETNP
jgi:hypothetical protein